jgi:hypothetical protein
MRDGLEVRCVHGVVMGKRGVPTRRRLRADGANAEAHRQWGVGCEHGVAGQRRAGGRQQGMCVWGEHSAEVDAGRVGRADREGEVLPW